MRGVAAHVLRRRGPVEFRRLAVAQPVPVFRCPSPVPSVDTRGAFAMTRYEIVVEGTAGSLVEIAVDGLAVEPIAGGRSRIVGDVIDQAHLQSLLHAPR